MKKRIYKTNEDYILDVLEEEEERLLERLGEILPEEIRYLFYRYISIKDTINKIRSKIA
jgi:hypothetical protein